MKVQLTRLTHRNKFRFALLALLALVLSGVPLLSQKAAFAQGKGSSKGDPQGLALCPLQFEATVHQGPNAEKFSLTGTPAAPATRQTVRPSMWLRCVSALSLPPTDELAHPMSAASPAGPLLLAFVGS